jgi:hypothetical protein
MQQFTSQIERECAIINLDFANDLIPYIAASDARELITLQVNFELTLIRAHVTTFHNLGCYGEI